jgi:LEA14-like dessication related protein
MKRISVLAAATSAVIVVAGCSALGHQAFASPVVSLKNVRVTGVGITGGSLDVVLSVYNPNNFRLDATQLNYKVRIDSTPLASGALDSRFTVQNKDSTLVHIPVTFTYAGLGAAGRSLMNSGALNYHVSGDVTVGSLVGNYTIPFSQTGRYSTGGH